MLDAQSLQNPSEVTLETPLGAMKGQGPLGVPPPKFKTLMKENCQVCLKDRVNLVETVSFEIE